MVLAANSSQWLPSLEHWWAEGEMRHQGMSEKITPSFLHRALKKISYFSKCWGATNCFFGRKPGQSGKSGHLQYLGVRRRPRRPGIPASLPKRNSYWRSARSGPEPFPNTRPCFENTDVNKNDAPCCWEIHSVVVDRDFFCSCTISFSVVKTVFQCRDLWILSLVGEQDPMPRGEKSKHKSETIL